VEPRDTDALARRGVTLGQEREGMVPIRGWLTREVAALLQRGFDAYLNPKVDDLAHGACAQPADALSLFDTGGAAEPVDTAHRSDQAAPTAAGAAFGIDGDDRTAAAGVPQPERSAEDRDPAGEPTPVKDTRQVAQKRHDALAGLLTCALQVGTAPGIPGAPLLQAAPATLVVTTTAEDLDDPQGVAFLQGTHDEATSAVPIAAALHAGCAGAIQHVVLDRSGAILGLTSPQRTFTAAQRRAISLRDGRCAIPGCDVPATYCEVHHVREWAQGGPTHTGNGVLLCWFHHRYLDTHGWEIRIAGGRPQVKAPPWINPNAVWRDTPTGLHHTHAAVRRRADRQ